MSKKVEVYFIMYLGLLMAFFGIESEVADYKKNQERILEQVAISKLDNLVRIKNTSQLKDNDGIFFSLELDGDFNPNSFEGNLLFDNNGKNIIKAPIIIDQGSVFTSSIKESQFEYPGKQHTVKMTYNAKPHFNDATVYELVKEFKDKKLVDKIINNIKKRGVVSNTIDVGLTVVPEAVVALPIFKISPKQNPLNSIKGLKGEIDLFIAGVKNENDYKIEIDANTRRRYKIGKIKYGKTQSKIPLGKLSSGTLEVIGTRKRDSNISVETIQINVQKPKWKYPNHFKKEIYTNSPYVFNGTLIHFDNINDLSRYKLKLSGLVNRTVSNHVYEFDKLIKAGNINIQLFIDDNKIEGMEHNIEVKNPPCPEFTHSQDGKILTLTVKALGKGNVIKNLIILKGGSKKGKPEIVNDSQEQTYTQIIILRDEPKVKLKVLIKSNYCKNNTIELPLINLQSL